MTAPARIAPRKAKAAKIERVPVRWRDGASRAMAIRAWRRAVMDRCAGRSRAITVAWSLEWLVAKDGQATATNEFLAAETGLPRQHIAPALDDLDEQGLIQRTPAPGRRRIITPTIPRRVDSHHTGGHDGHHTSSFDGHHSGGRNTESKYTPTPDEFKEAVRAEAQRLNRKKAMAFRVFSDGVAEGDREEIDRAAQIMSAALDDVSGGGRT